MRLYYGGYGHHPSGKQYVYRGKDNLRTGQNVVVKVTNKRTGNDYKTMFTLMRTTDLDSKMARSERGRLLRGGIGIKKIQGTDVLSELPSGELFDSKKAWAEDSDERYIKKIAARMARSRLVNMEI